MKAPPDEPGAAERARAARERARLLRDMPVTPIVKSERPRAGAARRKPGVAHVGGERLEGAAKVRALREAAADRGRKYVKPYGARDGFSRAVMGLVATQRDNVKALIAEDVEMANDFWQALRHGVKLGDKTCLELYAKILKLVDEERQVVVMVLQQLGMSSMEELERMVEVHKDHANITPEQRAAVCGDYLEMYLNAHPVERSAFIRRFGGEVVVRSDSFAEVVGGKAEADADARGSGA